MAELPAGTVTFLFTDIEGSTQLLRELGESYGNALADHRRILRAELGGTNGHEVDTQGDAFFFAFQRARDAVAGAVAAHRAIEAHEWPGGAQLRVRMGLHTGEPEVGEEGYHGLDVVRASRICSAAHGGQVLLSETTRALLGNDLPEGASVQDLGSHELKDIQEERVFELTFDDAPQEFPPLRTPVSPTSADALADSITRRVHEHVTRSIERALERTLAQPESAPKRRFWQRRPG
jgi:class 3 adenylate cyclase